MVWKTIKKQSKKLANYAVKRGAKFVKRRYLANPKTGVKNIVKDVMFLKSMLNAEKKRFNESYTNQTVAQVDGNSSGHLCLDVTPDPVSGAGYAQRTGASIKIHSMFTRIQAYQQSATNHPIRIKCFLVKVKGTPQNTTFFIQQFLQSNPFVSGTGSDTFDYYSSRNPDFFKQYEVLRTCTLKVYGDQLSNQTQIADRKMGMKPKSLHIRFDKDTTNVSENQLMFVAVADSGNSSGSTTSSATSGVPVTAQNTGCSISWATDWYYYDN